MLVAAAGTTLHTLEDMPDTAVFTFHNEDTVLFKRAYGRDISDTTVSVVCIAARNEARVGEVVQVKRLRKSFVPQHVAYTEDGLVLTPISYK